MVLSLLSNDVITLLDKLMMIYLRDDRIIYQCLSSLAVLSYTTEGLTYMKNMNGIMDHLQQILALYEESDDLASLATIILTKLGFAVL